VGRDPFLVVEGMVDGALSGKGKTLKGGGFRRAGKGTAHLLRRKAVGYLWGSGLMCRRRLKLDFKVGGGGGRLIEMDSQLQNYVKSLGSCCFKTGRF